MLYARTSVYTANAKTKREGDIQQKCIAGQFRPLVPGGIICISCTGKSQRTQNKYIDIFSEYLSNVQKYNEEKRRRRLTVTPRKKKEELTPNDDTEREKIEDTRGRMGKRWAVVMLCCDFHIHIFSGIYVLSALIRWKSAWPYFKRQSGPVENKIITLKICCKLGGNICLGLVPTESLLTVNYQQCVHWSCW